MALDLKRLHHISLCTSNVQRLVDFYVNILGYEKIERNRSNRKYDVCWLTKDNVQIHIIEKEENENIPGDPSNTNGRPQSGPEKLPRGHHFAFLTADYEGIKKKVQKMGIPYHARYNSDNWRQQIWFYDPDGNGIEVIQFNANYKSKL